MKLSLRFQLNTYTNPKIKNKQVGKKINEKEIKNYFYPICCTRKEEMKSKRIENN